MILLAKRGAIKNIHATCNYNISPFPEFCHNHKEKFGVMSS